VDYIDAEIAAIPTPVTPTLQTVTDAGNTTTNSIGIGTSTPTDKLEVVSNNNVGTTKIVSAVSLSGSQRTSLGYNSVMGSHSLSLVSQASDLYLFTTVARSIIFNTNNAEVARITDAGRVGIGTTAPTEKLHITGGGVGNIRLDAGGTYYGTNIQAISGAGLKIGNDDFSGYAFFADDGNVGIGTTAPTEKLEVVGYAKASTGFKLGNYGLVYDSSNDVNIKNAAYYHINFHTNNTQRMRITNAGNVGIGTSTPSSKLQVQSGVGNTQLDGHQILLSRAGNNHIFATNALGVLALGTNNAEKMRITSNGNVGIGTTAPAYKLDVNGDARVDNYLRFSSAGTYLRNNASGALVLASNSGYIETGWGARFRISDQSGSSKIMLYGGGDSYINGGNVGIGTTAPALQSGGTGLHINAPANSELKFTNDTTGSGAADGTAFVSSGSSFTINNREAGYLSLGTNNSARLRITSDGKVGIGTTTPESELTVNGYIQVPNGRGITFSDIGDGNANRVSIVGSEDNNTMFFKTNNSVRMAFASGNVGIGTTGPLAKLHVKDGNTLTAALPNTSALIEGFSQSILQVASHSTGYSQLAFGDQDDGFDGGLIYNNASRYLAIEAANTEQIRFTSNGNVGIGTTAPNSKVHISGTAMEQLRMETAGGPSSAGDASGRIGDMAYDDNFFYIKTANGWGRMALDFGY
jgi:hypothetical protein